MNPSGKFVIVDGLLTVEEILKPSWLVRRRINQASITSPYVWVATITQEEAPNAYEIKGYVSRDNHPMSLGERRALKRIVQKLGFSYGTYERVDHNGQSRASHSFDKNAQKTS